MSNLNRFIFSFFTATAFILCDTLSADWAKNHRNSSLLMMIILAPIGYFMFGIINKTNGLSISSGLVNIMIILGTISVGVTVFHDQLDLRQIMGLCLAILSIGLLA